MPPTKKNSKNKIPSSRQIKADETVRMNVNISKSFYKKIKQAALDEDSSITELVKKALLNYLP